MSDSGKLQSSDLKAMIRRLEEACQSRDRAVLLREIPRLLKADSGSGLLRLRALDWYWRAGLHVEGVRCALTLPGTGRIISSQSELLSLPEEQLLWASRLLISVGAWPFGRSLLAYLKPRSTRGRILLAMDHFALGDHGRVIETLEKVASPPAREVRWHIITTFARSWLELGEGTRAIEWANRGLNVVKTDPDRWVLECLRARAIALRGKPSQALQEFLTAEKRIHDPAVFAPHWYGYSRTWKGELLALNGKTKEARAIFEEGLAHYRTGMQDLQPWRSLLVLDAMKTHGLLNPEEVRAYDCYPLKPPLCRHQTVDVWNPAAPDIHFRLSAEEWRHEREWHLGIPLEWKLAAGLALSGELGIHQNLLKCWLWPDSLPLFFQLEGRLNQLVRRLRHEHSIEVIRERECLKLRPEQRNKISVDPAPDRIPSWLEARANAFFSSQELSAAYALSPRMSQIVIADWTQRGWIMKTGAGRTTRYQAVRSG